MRAAVVTSFAAPLELKEIPKPEPLRARGGVWFQVGEQQLHIGVEEPFAPARKAHPAFVVDDLDALAEALEPNVAWDEAIPGVRRFYSSDPWGNRLELLEH